MTGIDYRELTVNEPFKPLTVKIQQAAGRNHHGRITMRHQGGGNKNLYRMVDFNQMKLNVPGRVESIEYDPYRTAFIALVIYRDGERRYILAPKDLKAGDEIKVEVADSTQPVWQVDRVEYFPQGNQGGMKVKETSTLIVPGKAYKVTSTADVAAEEKNPKYRMQGRVETQEINAPATAYRTEKVSDVKAEN